MKRAACHEAGRIVMAFELAIRIKSVRVVDGVLFTDVMEDDLDSASRPAMERYAFLAGGIAAEKFKLGDYDRGAMGNDQEKVTQRNGAAIEIYIPDALRILATKEACLDRIRKQLTTKWIEARAAAQFDPDPDSYLIMSTTELDKILRYCKADI